MATYTRNPKTARLVASAFRSGLAAAAISYRKELRIVVGKKGKERTASAPGQPPQKDDGRYQRSIRIDRTKLRTVNLVTVFAEGSVPFKLEFGTPEQAARPHWIPTFRRLAPFMMKRVGDTMRYTIKHRLERSSNGA